MRIFDDASMFVRFASGLKSYLQPVTIDECRELLLERARGREESFLNLLEHGIFGYPQSPYLALLRWAGLDLEGVVELVRREGIEKTLELLYKAKVYVTLDEFKGRQPIRRNNLEVDVQPEGFDSPLATRHLEAHSGGSSGRVKRVGIDLDSWRHDAAGQGLFMLGFGVLERPVAVWRSPGFAGVARVFHQVRLDRQIERWFSHTKPRLRSDFWQPHFLSNYAVLASRFMGRRVPRPRYVPLSRVSEVVSWLAIQKEKGTPGYLDTNVSSAVRLCRLALEEGIDISGSFFRVGSEPFTPARAKVIAEAGCRSACHYAMAEGGTIGLGCGDPSAVDDVHLFKGKFALIQLPRKLSTPDDCVDAFYLTSLRSSAAKIMINVEVGDYGTSESRRCGCPLGDIGFDRHMHTIRSFEKLTSEGIHIAGSDLMKLLEEILPRTYGGGANDYQIVEDERSGLPQVSLVISPSVGPLETEAVIRTVLDFLGTRSSANELTTEYWRQGGTLQVVRRDPYTTPASKVQALHILRS
jgi:hypothetical protein